MCLWLWSTLASLTPPLFVRLYCTLGQEATVEAELKQELARQVAGGKDKKKREAADLGELNVMRSVDLMGQLTGLSDGQGGLVEKLIPGQCFTARLLADLGC